MIFFVLQLLLQVSTLIAIVSTFTPTVVVHPLTIKSKAILEEHTITTTRTTTTTLLRYKNDDSDNDNNTENKNDSSYPIPAGTKVVTLTTNIPSIIRKKDVLFTRQYDNTTTTTNNNNFEGDCFYPIPVGGSGGGSDDIHPAILGISKKTSTLEPEVIATPIITITPTPVLTSSSSSFTNRKPIITQISTFQEFCDYLQEDDRLTVVKFYAPWCKSCQKLSMNLNKIIYEYGDIIQNRKKISGTVRFAQVEYTPSLQHNNNKNNNFISSTLQISGIPTIQLYQNIYKIWDLSGITKATELEQQIKLWHSLFDNNNNNVEERIQYAQTIDDGVLSNAIENAFYDEPDFLNEEW